MARIICPRHFAPLFSGLQMPDQVWHDAKNPHGRERIWLEREANPGVDDRVSFVDVEVVSNAKNRFDEEMSPIHAADSIHGFQVEVDVVSISWKQITAGTERYKVG